MNIMLELSISHSKPNMFISGLFLFIIFNNSVMCVTGYTVIFFILYHGRQDETQTNKPC